jgi:SAM-dependent methyltransferase
MPNAHFIDRSLKVVYRLRREDIMPAWVFIALFIIGGLIAAKLLLTASIVTVFPITRGAMFHPSASVRVKTVLDRVPMAPGELLVDIGCGDGRVLCGARRRYGVRALGFEVNPLAYVMARLRTLGMSGVEVRCADFWKAGLDGADVVFCYLFPDVMKRLAEKLAAELRPGTRVVSCNFPLPGWTPQEILRPDSSLHGDPIYLYRYPEACGFVSSERS